MENFGRSTDRYVCKSEFRSFVIPKRLKYVLVNKIWTYLNCIKSKLYLNNFKALMFPKLSSAIYNSTKATQYMSQFDLMFTITLLLEKNRPSELKHYNYWGQKKKCLFDQFMSWFCVKCVTFHFTFSVVFLYTIVCRSFEFEALNVYGFERLGNALKIVVWNDFFIVERMIEFISWIDRVVIITRGISNGEVPKWRLKKMQLIRIWVDLKFHIRDFFYGLFVVIILLCEKFADFELMYSYLHEIIG